LRASSLPQLQPQRYPSSQLQGLKTKSILEETIKKNSIVIEEDTIGQSHEAANGDTGGIEINPRTRRNTDSDNTEIILLNNRIVVGIHGRQMVHINFKRLNFCYLKPAH
jgi:hypothetical protein